MHIPVIVHKDKNSDYGVIVPDFPGVFSGGSTLEDALANVQEALTLRFCDGETCIIPQISSLESILASPDLEGGAVLLLDIDPAPFAGDAPAFSHLPLPLTLRDRIDELANARGISAAALVAEALTVFLTHQEKA